MLSLIENVCYTLFSIFLTSHVKSKYSNQTFIAPTPPLTPEPHMLSKINNNSHLSKVNKLQSLVLTGLLEALDTSDHTLLARISLRACQKHPTG